MSFSVIKKPTVSLTRQEYLQCFGLNYGPEGMMQEILTESIRDCLAKDWTYLIKDGDCIASWALVYETEEKPLWAAMFWTRVSYRRRGLGRQLVKAIQEDIPRCYVIPHDEVSHIFFRKTRRGRRKAFI